MDKKTLLSIKKLRKTYGDNEGKTIALNDVDLEIYDGELLVILGSSGSGKSTLLNLIGGMDYPDSGVIELNGENICEYNDIKLTDYRKNTIGFVFQSFNLIQGMTTSENISMCLDYDDQEKVDSVLKIVDLVEKKDSYPSQMSGGQQQRVSIARALIKDAPILLCDEPTGALDYETGKQILIKLEELSRVYNKTVVIVTHTKEIGDMGDRVIEVRNGKITKTIVNEKIKTAKEIEW